MPRLTTLAALFVGLFALATAPALRAQDFNPMKRTYLTFSAPVELPGVTLPAGAYTFQIADTPSRNVVQVLSRDGKKIHGQWLFVQSQRAEATDDPVIMFKETAEGTTPAVQYWYYPGERMGREFVYPKNQALKIAARTHTKVLSTEGELSANSRVSSVNDQGQATPYEPPAPAPQARVQQPSAPVTTPAASNEPAPREPVRQYASSQLPATASPAPFAGLIGLLSIAGAIALQMRRRA